MTETLCLEAPDEESMVALGRRIAAVLEPGAVVFLGGDLGMGKTTLCRGILRGCGHGGAVKSPTYTLVEPYDLPGQTLYHFDLYRLGSPDELEYMGIRDYFTDRAICLIEWPERGRGVLPPADLVITIERSGSGRRVRLRGQSAKSEQMLQRLA